ncbi:acyl-CoA/acyl-ACP dehydrogenase [Parahaliea sp. F7430]|uniref:Acyl-CoA/acyl-ACP dehydrogenase n=1 Tax=Sediminihaliea albiluteola TaxID=2758564 RepID=A0A7W2TU52_9GAMM|nr:acyl-CoA dehydrogenase family protein [Sediminihaliea albiluteola]MBA6412006.1 acyl-CoA/acyl-ACP dehydrogenase [Sediminihaliea albiluteola]
MKQPNDFSFGEEASLLKDSARKFFAEHLPVESLHRLVAADHNPDRAPEVLWRADLWQQMVELGWTMLAVPERSGGLGMPLVAVAGLVEELGRAAFPCPLLGTLNVSYILAAAGEGADAALQEIIAGKAAALAMTNRHGDWELEHTELRYKAGKLNGSAWFVQDAAKVDYLLAVAQTDSGYGLYWVAADSEGVTLTQDAIVDLTRDQAHISFDNVAAQEISGKALSALTQAFPAIWTLLAADIVGAAEWQLQTTVEYVSTRQQFDRPLGFFQAVKHPLVNVMLKTDQAKSLVYNAACAYDCEPAAAAKYAHMALASASDLAGFASSRSVQYHGGIGFTWECFVHLYFKRQKHSQALWGDASWHRARMAEIVFA